MELAIYEPDITYSVSKNLTIGILQSTYGIVIGVFLMTGSCVSYFFIMAWQRRMLDPYEDPYNFALLTVPVVYTIGQYVVPLSGPIGFSLVTAGMIAGDYLCICASESIFNCGLNMFREGIKSAVRTLSYVFQNVLILRLR